MHARQATIKVRLRAPQAVVTAAKANIKLQRVRRCALRAQRAVSLTIMVLPRPHSALPARRAVIRLAQLELLFVLPAQLVVILHLQPVPCWHSVLSVQRGNTQVPAPRAACTPQPRDQPCHSRPHRCRYPILLPGRRLGHRRCLRRCPPQGLLLGLLQDRRLLQRPGLRQLPR